MTSLPELVNTNLLLFASLSQALRIGLAVLALLGIVALIAALGALRRWRVFVALPRLLFSIACLSVAALLLTLALATQGFVTLSAEQEAASVRLQRQDYRHYRALFRFPDGESRSFDIAGEQLYVDATILKWHPMASVVGLHTAYNLDRVAGRYRSLDDEQTLPRSVYRLAQNRPVEVGNMLEHLPWLRYLVDAEYGSGTYIPMDDGVYYRIMVSNSGLLVRTLEDSSQFYQNLSLPSE